MADITLKAYLAHVDDLLGRRQYEEAEAHSKHILAKYPKNLAALRRLAKAQLEAGHYPEAENTYANVISLEPRSTEAYIGLSWVARQRGQGDQTIALLERAYEQDTSNQDVVQLLRDAHRTFNDRTNAKLPQTQYVAARQQWRSGLEQQAIATLNTALNADPSRADIRLLKAQILTQMGNNNEAARTVTDVLKQLPDCVEANRMLAEFWKAQGRSSDAQRFVNHVEAADPFLAFEIATGAPPPDEALMLSLLDYRTTSSVTSAASSTPDWLGELGMTELGQPTPTQRSTPKVEGEAGELDWLDQGAAAEEAEPTERSWLKEAVSGSSLPDDLSWLNEAASAEDVNFGEADDFSDFAAAFNTGAEDDADMPALEMDWMDNDRADDGETMPSVSTRMAEEEIKNADNLREFSEMAADADVPQQPVEEDWMNTIQSASTDPTLPERQDFDDFLKNYTSFNDMTPETAQSSGTGLTGLLSSLTTPEDQANPDVADIDPEDPLAWMRDATLRDGTEQDMPDLGALLGEDSFARPDGEAPAAFNQDATDAAPADQGADEEYTLPALPNADNPYAWMQEHDIEMVDETPGPSLWDDPLGVENMQTIDESEVDPLAWMKEAGIAPEEAEPAATPEDTDDSAPDPFAWAKESGLDLLDEVNTANHAQTAALSAEMALMGAADNTPSPFDDPTAIDQPPTNASGLLAFIKDGDTVQQGDAPMNDKDLPDWLSDPDDGNEPAKNDEPTDLSEFDWMAVAPAEADAEIDWDAAPEDAAVTDEAPPDWLASLENPGDASEAAGLSAQDDPNVPNVWESAADDETDSEMPAWMATLRDEPAAEEAASDAADWVFSESEASTDELAAMQDDLLVSAAQAHDAALDAVNELATNEGEAMDWLGAGAPEEQASQIESDDSEDMAWLNAAVSSGDEASTPEAAEIADTGAEVGLDWLSAAATADVSGDDAAVQDAAAATGEDMDWLNAAAPEASLGDAAEDSEFDWMADVAKATESEAGEAASASDFTPGDFDSDAVEAGPSDELAEAEADFLSELNASDRPVSLGDTDEPAFELSYIEEDTPTEDVATVELEGDPLPDWMIEMKPESQPLKLDVDVPDEQLSVAGSLAGEILDDADLLEAEPPAQESLTASAVNSPDWLNAMVPGLEVGTDLPEDDDDDAEFMNSGRGDFGWLSGIVDEELAPPAMAAPARRVARFPFSEPPAWLSMLRDETQATPVLDADNDDDSLPDWLKFDDAETN